VQHRLDAAFARPVDAARLFVRVVKLIADRRHEGEPTTGVRRRPRITGVVGVVEGNDLFHRAARALFTVVPPVNAGPILESALRELGGNPLTLSRADLAAMLASGRLAAALSMSGEPEKISEALERMYVLVA
jgi:hypothetical protein